MSYPHSTYRILDVLEDLHDIVSRALDGDLNRRFLEEALGNAQDVINDSHRETDKILQVATALAQEDCTLSLAGSIVRRRTGYMVGGDPLVTTVVNPTRKELVTFVERARNVYGFSRSHFLGRWTDDDGNVHYDVSELVKGYYAATHLGRQRGEQEVWSWAHNASLPIQDEKRFR